MKELSIKEKAKAYDEALEKAKDYVEKQNPSVNILYEIFTELAKSDDEKMLQEIKRYIKEQGDKPTGLPNGNVAITDMLAWLEKQGEQKPDGNIKPTFKVGDWIVFNNQPEKGSIYQIEKNENFQYTLRHFLGGSMPLSFSREDMIRLWTIQDAKDGDVLVYGDNPNDHHIRIIMLFKSMRTFNSAFNHFHIFADDFRINDWCDCGKTAHPATKEQCDLLFAKMHEAGYEWDAEKKELKKIEQNPAWSEDDEEMLKSLKALLNEISCYSCTEGVDRILSWLKNCVKYA